LSTLLHAGSADLVTIMHGLHLLDPDAALTEVARLLRADGFLAAAWNDRWEGAGVEGGRGRREGCCQPAPL
jgi:SAM-dependent methyltransferase